MDKYYNPYQNQELRYPQQFIAKVQQYSQTGADSSPSRSPFPRMVDFWFLALCIGAKEGKVTQVIRDKSHKFIEGSIFTSDPWRVELLSLLAVGFTGGPEILSEPGRVIGLANGLAATGFPILIDILDRGGPETIWSLSDEVLEMLGASGSDLKTKSGAS